MGRGGGGDRRGGSGRRRRLHGDRWRNSFAVGGCRSHPSVGRGPSRGALQWLQPARGTGGHRWLPQGLVVGGTPRWYLLTTPAPGTPSPSTGVGGTPGITPRPLVLDFHGVAEPALLQSETSRFGSLGQQDGFVVVTPSGTGDPVHWNTTDHDPSNPDLEFVSALLDQVEATQCIDTSRVYASGFSDGTVSWHRSWPAPWPEGSPPSVPCRASNSRRPATRAGPSRSSPSTGRPTRSVLQRRSQLPVVDRTVGTGRPGGPALHLHPTTPLERSGHETTVQGWAVKDGCSPNRTDTAVGETRSCAVTGARPGSPSSSPSSSAAATHSPAARSAAREVRRPGRGPTRWMPPPITGRGHITPHSSSFASASPARMQARISSVVHHQFADAFLGVRQMRVAECFAHQQRDAQYEFAFREIFGGALMRGMR